MHWVLLKFSNGSLIVLLSALQKISKGSAMGFLRAKGSLWGLLGVLERLSRGSSRSSQEALLGSLKVFPLAF